MKRVLLIFGLLLSMIVANTDTVEAQVVVRVRPNRPNTVVVKRPAARKGQVWIAGHWKVNKRGTGYSWVSGRWVRARKGFRYVPGRWVKVRGGHRWKAGTWVRV